MKDFLFSADQSASAEPWLLPEVKSRHLVTIGNSGKSAGGYHQRSSDPKSPHKISDISSASGYSASMAMTASKLVELEAKAVEKGFEEGRADGYGKGYAEGSERADTLGNERLARMDELIQSIEAEVVAEADKLKTLLSSLVIKISRELCERELRLEPAVEKLVSKAVDALPIGENAIAVHLHPDDAKAIEAIPGFVQSNWQLQSDSLIEMGGCVIKSNHSTVDFSFSKRLHSIINDVFGEDIADIDDQ